MKRQSRIEMNCFTLTSNEVEGSWADEEVRTRAILLIIQKTCLVEEGDVLTLWNEIF